MTDEQRAATEDTAPDFAQDAQRLPWLPLLLSMQEITDRNVRQSIKRDGRRLACGRGCASCCRTHADIPVYPLELMGISWYVVEKMHDPIRAQVQAQLAHHRERDACPFLVDEACAVHPVRPMACRLFNVFSRPCQAGEDAYHSRRGDVLTPKPSLKNEALALMLTHHGITDSAARMRMAKSGEVHRFAQSLRAMQWEKLAERMAAFSSGPTST